MLGLDTLLHNTDNNNLPQKQIVDADANFVSHRYLVYTSSLEIKHALPLFTFLKKAID
jgi:hypothetical protein